MGNIGEPRRRIEAPEPVPEHLPEEEPAQVPEPATPKPERVPS